MSIPFFISTNPFPLDFEISHLYVPDISLQNLYSSPTTWPPYECLFKFLNEGLYTITLPSSQLPLPSMDAAQSPSSLATRLVRFPASLGWCHLIAIFSDHSALYLWGALTHKRTNRTKIIEFEYRDGPDGRAPTADATARLLCTLALLPYVFSFVTLPDIRLPTSGPQSCTCSVDKHTMSGPHKSPACSAAFLIFTIGAITIRDYMLTRIAIFVFFLQTSRTIPDRYERPCSERGRMTNIAWEDSGLRGCRLAMEWAVWRRYNLSRNASVTSSGLESKWCRGGEGAGAEKALNRRVLR